MKRGDDLFETIKFFYLSTLFLWFSFLYFISGLDSPNQVNSWQAIFLSSTIKFVQEGWQDKDIYETGINAWLPYFELWYVEPLV